MSESTPAPGGLSISSAIEDGVASIVLHGELDLATAPELEHTIASIEEHAPSRLVIDLRDLQFIDSTGLRLLLQADARWRKRGAQIVLRPGEDAVQRVFDVTGARDVLRFEDAAGGYAGGGDAASGEAIGGEASGGYAAGADAAGS
jgi:anti-anti-sigma factor